MKRLLIFLLLVISVSNVFGASLSVSSCSSKDHCFEKECSICLDNETSLVPLCCAIDYVNEEKRIRIPSHRVCFSCKESISGCAFCRSDEQRLVPAKLLDDAIKNRECLKHRLNEQLRKEIFVNNKGHTKLIVKIKELLDRGAPIDGVLVCDIIECFNSLHDIHKRLDILHLLLPKLNDINVSIDEYGQTLAHKAVSMRSPEVLLLLIKYGACLNKPALCREMLDGRQLGLTPLQMLLPSENVILESLVAQEENKKNEYYNALRRAIFSDDDYYDPKGKGKEEACGGIPMVQMLLSQGAPVDVGLVRDVIIYILHSKFSPDAGLQIIRLLLPKLKDINAPINAHGQTLAHQAIESKSLECLRLLVLNGADLNKPALCSDAFDSRQLGKTPLEVLTDKDDLNEFSGECLSVLFQSLQDQRNYTESLSKDAKNNLSEGYMGACVDQVMHILESEFFMECGSETLMELVRAVRAVPNTWPVALAISVRAHKWGVLNNEQLPTHLREQALKDSWEFSNWYCHVKNEIYDDKIHQRSVLDLMKYVDIPSIVCETKYGLTLHLADSKLTSLEGLSSIPSEIRKKIRCLCLNGNKLKKIEPNVFKGFSNLKRIFLEDNQIQSIAPRAFNGICKLEHLHLHNNCMQVIEPGVFKGLKRLQRLYLQNNRLHKLRQLDKSFKAVLPCIEAINLGNQSRDVLEGQVFYDDVSPFQQEGNIQPCAVLTPCLIQ
jgi:ankyrin repeat protein